MATVIIRLKLLVMIIKIIAAILIRTILIVWMMLVIRITLLLIFKIMTIIITEQINSERRKLFGSIFLCVSRVL